VQISPLPLRGSARISSVCVGVQIVVMPNAPGFVFLPDCTEIELPKANGPASERLHEHL
jgi:hypothetical protein